MEEAQGDVKIVTFPRLKKAFYMGHKIRLLGEKSVKLDAYGNIG
jgi:hypothetical protein